ncbi:DUF2390 domain-containing protein [Thioalkalivibrio sp. ALE16]|uniref:DUF2390 domain-containing protein n=1 Tax=Thioalkalivibrio sp. ALE16 TaxID=1158172 RepID=UPI00035DEC11|nr:DUF2390 domain-containing protein [Thioalkalivibrio sp. ALE16]
MPESGGTPEEPSTDFEAFWRFAGTLWADPDARARLLRWQEDFGVDVMLALFALWYPRPLTTSQWQRLAQTARRWQTSATGRIRALRRQLHTPERDTLYRAVLALELQSERLAGLQLLAQARQLSTPDSRSHAVNHRRRLHTLFPALPEAEIRDAPHTPDRCSQ